MVLTVSLIILVLLLSSFLLTLIGYFKKWQWTGVLGSKTPKDERPKTLWDWLEILIVPAVLALGGLYFTAAQEQRQTLLEQDRAEAARRLEERRSNDTKVQAYLDQMGDLMIDRGLGQPDAADEVRTVATARTVTTLRGLSPEHKRSIVRFLNEANLIDKDETVIDLAGANLTHADLSAIDLGGTDLSHVDLRRADLRDCSLRDADLSYANLNRTNLEDGADEGTEGAYLNEADLSHAKLKKARLTDADLSGAIMPQG